MEFECLTCGNDFDDEDFEEGDEVVCPACGSSDVWSGFDATPGDDE